MFLEKMMRGFKNLSSARMFLIRADALKEYKHFDEALIEAKKARDAKDASPVEIELAKGKIVEVFNNIEKIKQHDAKINHTL